MKKFISMVLTVAMIVTFIMPAMAADTKTADSGLENAIKAVKEKIEIPKECSKFNYNVDNRDGLVVWRLSWSNDELQKHVSVSIDESGQILNYSIYDNKVYNKKIPKYSKEEARKLAEKFVNKLDSKLLSQFKLVEENKNIESGNCYDYNYLRQVNGINYSQNSINVSVNYFTGEIANYYCNYSKNIIFEDATKIISIDNAKKAFIEKLGVKMVYKIKNQNDKISTYLAYIPKESAKYISAISGDVKSINNNYSIYLDEDGMMEAKASSNANVALTPEEINAVKGISTIISKEEADKTIRNNSFFSLDSGFELSDAYLSKDWNSSDLLTWSLTYKKIIDKEKNSTRRIRVTIEAKSSEIQNFDINYISEAGAKPQKTKEQAKAICEDTLKKLIPNTFAKVKYDESYNVSDDNKLREEYTFRYTRMENGLEVPENYISITYDNLTGNVCSMYSNWIRNLKFDEPKNTITIDKAYDILFSKIGYELKYINDYSDINSDNKTLTSKKDSYKAVLGYFIKNNKPNVISAVTGDILNNSGNIYKEKTISDYTDIKGLKEEGKIKILTQMSIGYVENMLKPKEKLLQKDYFLLLSKLTDRYNPYENFEDNSEVEQMYMELINMGIITKEEKAPMSTLTREEAAKYFIKFLNLTEAAEIKGIYKCSFKDVKKINDKLIGYVCLASGLKALNGNQGYFNPKDKVTRLDGLMIIYSYLSNK